MGANLTMFAVQSNSICTCLMATSWPVRVSVAWYTLPAREEERYGSMPQLFAQENDANFRKPEPDENKFKQ